MGPACLLCALAAMRACCARLLPPARPACSRPRSAACSTRAPPLAPSTRAGSGGSAGMGSERGRPEIPPPGRSSSSSRAATSSTGEAPPPKGRGRGRRRATRARPPGQGRAAARAHGASPPGSRVRRRRRTSAPRIRLSSMPARSRWSGVPPLEGRGRGGGARGKRERERRKDGRPGEGGGSPVMEEGREGGAPRAVVRLLLLRPSKWGGVGGREELGGGHTKLATPNPARERPNDWKNAFNLTLTLASKHVFG